MIAAGLARRVIALGLAGAAAFGAGWTTNGWRKDAQLAELAAARAQADLTSANLALSDVHAASRTMRQQADQFNADQAQLAVQLSNAVKEFRNAKKPLPAGCRPDDFRVRKLAEAVAAAKAAAGAR